MTLQTPTEGSLPDTQATATGYRAGHPSWLRKRSALPHSPSQCIFSPLTWQTPCPKNLLGSAGRGQGHGPSVGPMSPPSRRTHYHGCVSPSHSTTSAVDPLACWIDVGSCHASRYRGPWLNVMLWNLCPALVHRGLTSRYVLCTRALHVPSPRTFHRLVNRLAGSLGLLLLLRLRMGAYASFVVFPWPEAFHRSFSCLSSRPPVAPCPCLQKCCDRSNG